MPVVKIVPMPGPQGKNGYTPQIISDAGEVTANSLMAGKFLYNTSGAQSRFIVPTNLTISFPVGTEIKFINDGESSWTFTRENTELTTLIAEGQNYFSINGIFYLPQNGIATLIKVETERWILSGIRVND